MNVLPICMCTVHVQAWYLWWSQELSGYLKLGLHMVVNYHVGAENQNMISLQDWQILLTAEPSPQPLLYEYCICTLCLCTMCIQCPQSPEKDFGFPETGEQPVLLTTKPSLRPWVVFLNYHSRFLIWTGLVLWFEHGVSLCNHC